MRGRGGEWCWGGGRGGGGGAYRSHVIITIQCYTIRIARIVIDIPTSLSRKKKWNNNFFSVN